MINQFLVLIDNIIGWALVALVVITIVLWIISQFYKDK